ncbi:hypothetical protein D3C86_1307450 [compost metagenome]
MARRYCQFSPGRHRIPRIDDKIEQRGFKLGGIGKYRAIAWTQLVGKRDGRADRSLEQLSERRQALAHVEHVRLQRLLFRVGQQLPGELRRPFSRFNGDGHITHQRCGQFRRPLQKLGGKPYRGQKVIEVMRDASGQAAYGFHALRVMHGIAGSLKLLPAQLLLRDVPRDLCKADQPAVIVMDRVDDNAAPEPAPVLAHPPPFRLEPSFARSRLQRYARDACGPVFFCVENRKMLADDLVRPIPLESFGPRVPAADHSIDVQQIDGVVHHGIHQEPVGVVRGEFWVHVRLAQG